MTNNLIDEIFYRILLANVLQCCCCCSKSLNSFSQFLRQVELPNCAVATVLFDVG